jgi:prepilin-type N-terminal cleavage/methylation domain-containing protein
MSWTEKQPRAATRRAGVTLLELIVVMAVMSVAVAMFTSMVLHTTRQRGINRENAVASNAARTILEEMRNEDFREVFARYNGDPSDDPGGAGTAPGDRFVVRGLTPQPGDPDGIAGEIHFPVIYDDPKPPASWGHTTLDLLGLELDLGVLGPLGEDLGEVLGGLGGGLLGGGLLGGGGGLLGGGGGLLGGGGGEEGEDLGLPGGGVGLAHYTLREDFSSPRMGLPRDLNGDSLIDDCDHSADYIILPVHVEVEWRGKFGPRRFDLYTQFAALAREDG